MSQMIPASFKMPTHLVCNLCNQALPVDQFTRNVNRHVWSGRGAWSGRCRTCTPVYWYAWFLENREARNARRRAKYAEDKAREKSMAGWAPASRAAVEAAAEKRKQDAKARAERKALLKWIDKHSPTYTPPKLRYGRWKGMTMAEVWKVVKTERGVVSPGASRDAKSTPGTRMTPAQSAANLEALRTLHKAQRGRD